MVSTTQPGFRKISTTFLQFACTGKTWEKDGVADSTVIVWWSHQARPPEETQSFLRPVALQNARSVDVMNYHLCAPVALIWLDQNPALRWRNICRIRSNSRGCEASSRQDGEAGLHPPPVNWDVWKPGQHRHCSGQLTSESVGHHIRSPDCHDLSLSESMVRLRWCGRLCVDTCRQEVAVPREACLCSFGVSWHWWSVVLGDTELPSPSGIAERPA